MAAQKVAYNENTVYSGPTYKFMKAEGNKIVLIFDNVGSGLVAKGGDLKEFAIAGPDKKFVWADAKIQGNTVIVSSDQVTNPVAVRYAWANNSDKANLYNKEGLPVSPFCTDDWPGITIRKINTRDMDRQHYKKKYIYTIAKETNNMICVIHE